MNEGGRVIVVGGGAAGMCAAAAALESGASVTLFEPNRFLGRKLRITGKGRCNLTNNCSPEEALKNVLRGQRFMYGPMFRFPPEEVMVWFEALGVPLKTERGRRVFPVSDKAADVAQALDEHIRSLGAVIIHEKVTEVCFSDGVAAGVIAAGRRYAANAVIVATGGISYPATGSRGDGYRFAKSAGLQVLAPSPSLVPVNTAENVSLLAGLTLKNVQLSLCGAGGKKLFSSMGELLFTHSGISGPLVLSASAHMQGQPIESFSMSIDLKPAIPQSELNERLIRELAEGGQKEIANAIVSLLPRAMGASVLSAAGVDPHTRCCDMTKVQRLSLCAALKKFPITPVSLGKPEEAVITAGGVDTRELSPKTMMAKRVPGLFFAGEVIDADAYTGGYNLQIAWATGRAAGQGAADYSFSGTGA